MHDPVTRPFGGPGNKNRRIYFSVSSPAQKKRPWRFMTGAKTSSTVILDALTFWVADGADRTEATASGVPFLCGEYTPT